MPKKKARRTTKSTTTARRAAPTSIRSGSEVVMETSSMSSFRQLLAMFVGLFVVNTVGIGLANWLFPTQVVLGNHLVDMWSALFMTSLILTAIDVGATPVIEAVSGVLNRTFSNMEWMVIYLAINVVSLWSIARLAEMVGLGISSWVVAIVLGLVLNFLQSLVAMKVMNPRPTRVA